MNFTLPNYDNWKTKTPDDVVEVAFDCDHCEEPIYVGEEYYDTTEGEVHEDCLDEYTRQILGVNLRTAENKY